MKIAMMGSGGVGGYYGARLAQSGHEVSFIARGAQGEAMRKSGLRVKSELGDLHLQPVRVFENPAQVGQVDLVVLAVKLWDTEKTAASLGPMIGPQAAVVSLQNGVDKDEILSRAVGREHVIGGVTHIGVVIAEPGVIAHTGKLARVTLGELDGSQSKRLGKIVEAFKGAGVETILSEDIRRVTWEKFAFLTAVSGLTALTRKPIGEVRSHPATRALLHEALREAAAVARAEGAALPDDFADAQLRLVDSLPPAMLSSMAQDLLRGRPLELEWLSGAVVRRGERKGIPTPVHCGIYAGLVLWAQPK
jgi:2-dehydropantoate 2-reductase